MTRFGEITSTRVLQAAAEQVRVSVFGGKTQLDIALPLDLPIAAFAPELVELVLTRNARADADAASHQDRRMHWVLRRRESGEQLNSNATLRESGIENGDLLHLVSERTLVAPTLYDDVVDAAARLNRSSYAPWDGNSARLMGFAGLYLVSFALVYFQTLLSYRAQWPAITALSLVVVVMLLTAGAVANRSYARVDIASALAWSTIPVSTAACWVFLHGHGLMGLAIGCLAMLVANFGAYRLVGTGAWGFLASSILFALLGIALAVQGVVKPDPALTATVLAVTSTLLVLAVPSLTASLGQFDPPTVEHEDAEAELLANPFQRVSVAENAESTGSADSIPTAENVRQRVRSAVTVRSALFVGLAAAAGIGALANFLWATGFGWAELALAAVVASVLALRGRLRPTSLEKAALMVPAAAIAILSCMAARTGPPPIPLVTFGFLLALTLALSLVGLRFAGGRRSRRATTALAYLEYFLIASLIPVGLWVVGVFTHLGTGQ